MFIQICFCYLFRLQILCHFPRAVFIFVVAALSLQVPVDFAALGAAAEPNNYLILQLYFVGIRQVFFLAVSAKIMSGIISDWHSVWSGFLLSQ